MDETHSKRRSLALLLLIAAILVISAITGFLTWKRITQGAATDKENLLVIVEAEGRMLYAVPLSDDVTLPVNTKDAFNEVRVENGEVYMAEADCKNQICVNTAPINSPGRSIICLPHRVVVSVCVRTAIDKKDKE